MVGKEGAPALAGRSRIATPAIAADRARTDHDPELEEFAADALTAPERILVGHGGDQLPNLKGSIGAGPADGLSASAPGTQQRGDRYPGRPLGAAG